MGNISVELEGTPEAVSSTIRQLEGNGANHARKGELKAAIQGLLDDGFLDSPRRLSEIKAELLRRAVLFNPVSLFPVIYKAFLQTHKIRQDGKRGQFKYKIGGAKR